MGAGIDALATAHQATGARSAGLLVVGGRRDKGPRRHGRHSTTGDPHRLGPKVLSREGPLPGWCPVPVSVGRILRERCETRRGDGKALVDGLDPPQGLEPPQQPGHACDDGFTEVLAIGCMAPLPTFRYGLGASRPAAPERGEDLPARPG